MKYNYIKRFFDVLASLILLALLFVPYSFLLVYLFIFSRPVFFFQIRTGLRGRSFTIIKLRTLKVSSHVSEEVVTPIGSFLRASSLDEIPQLINVLIGDMSLVGPRPLLPQYLSRYSPHQSRRLLTPPGITGLSQVLARNQTTWEKRLATDVYYTSHISFLLDLKILLLTLSRLFRFSSVNNSSSLSMPEFKPSSDKSPL